MEFNDRFFKDLLVSAPVENLVMNAAEEVAAQARATAPVDTGGYRSGIVVTKKYQERVVGLVQATDPASMIVEAKTGNLARAVRSKGRRS
jgi:hypothetical protein